MLGESLAYHGVQRARALEAVPERLLDDHPHPRRCPGIPLLGRNAAPVEVTDYLRVHAGRDRQVEQATPSRGARAVPVHSFQPRSERGVGLRVVQVPGHIEEALAEAVRDLRLAAVARELVQRVSHRRPERRVVESLSRDADHGEARREEAVLPQVVQRGEQLAACEVASSAEDDERARLRRLRREGRRTQDRKSTRLNSSHGYISYAVFCFKKKKNKSCEN